MDRLTDDRDRVKFPEVWARDAWVKEQASRISPGSFVLDAGAGASKYRPFFSHCQYKTQDFCEYKGPLVQYLQPIDYVCDITSIPLSGESVDVILCTEVFEHVVDPVKVLREFNRLLKPNGQLLLTAPMISHLHMEPFHYFGGFTHHWYRHWLPACGFEIHSMTPVGGAGRTCTAYVQTFYQAWSQKEKHLGGPQRLFSKMGRGALKIFAHYVLPRTLPKFDSWLGADLVCSGYLVAARRL